MTYPQVDIKGNDIFELSPELLTTLLKDHTLSSEDKQVDISGPCTFVSVKGQDRMASTNFLNDSNVGFVVRDAVAQKIISKIQSQSTESFMTLIGPNILFCDRAKGILSNP